MDINFALLGTEEAENIARVWFDCFLSKWELNVIINLPIEKKTHFIFTGFRLPQVVVNCLISRKSQKRSQPCILSETSLVCLRFEDNISFWTSKKVFLGKKYESIVQPDSSHVSISEFWTERKMCHCVYFGGDEHTMILQGRLCQVRV